jgi:hypothetical protein
MLIISYQKIYIAVAITFSEVTEQPHDCLMYRSGRALYAQIATSNDFKGLLLKKNQIVLTC